MKITNKHNLPESIYNVLKSDDYDYDPSTISVTTLIDSPYIRKLKKEHWNELEEDCTDRIWAVLGSSVHNMLEKADDENIITEKRLSKEIDGIKISGKFDRYNKKTKTLQDYKITSVWSVIYKSRIKEWSAQLNIYKWLLEQEGYEVDKIEVICILRDWVQSKSKEDNYPDVQIQVINIPIATNEYIENYIQKRIKAHKENKICSKKERWAIEDKWAVMQKGRKSAIKLFDNETDSKKYKEELNDSRLYIECRKGKDKRCENYCNVNKFCEYYNKEVK